MKFLKFEHIIILGLLTIILFMRMCSPKPTKCPPTTNTTTTVVKWDTIKFETPHYFPKPYKTIKYDTIPGIVDTNEIINNYYYVKFYNDSLTNDSLKLYINDIVYHNSIVDRKIKYAFKYKSTVTTNTIFVHDSVKKRNQVYYGFNLMATKTNFNYFGGGVILKNKKDQIYQINLGINNNLNPIVGFGMYWKIGKK